MLDQDLAAHGRRAAFAVVGACFFLSACASYGQAATHDPVPVAVVDETSAPDDTTPQIVADTPRAFPDALETGVATYYARSFDGRRTASGERYDMNALSAAHRTLPLGSYVRVTNVRNKRSTIVRINDRGPFVKNRVIDLSFAAATLIGLRQAGQAPVTLERISADEARAQRAELAPTPAAPGAQRHARRKRRA